MYLKKLVEETNQSILNESKFKLPWRKEGRGSYIAVYNGREYVISQSDDRRWYIEGEDWGFQTLSAAKLGVEQELGLWTSNELSDWSPKWM